MDWKLVEMIRGFNEIDKIYNDNQLTLAKVHIADRYAGMGSDLRKRSASVDGGRR